MSYDLFMTVIGVDTNWNGIRNGRRDRARTGSLTFGRADQRSYCSFGLVTDAHVQFIAP